MLEMMDRVCYKTKTCQHNAFSSSKTVLPSQASFHMTRFSQDSFQDSCVQCSFCRVSFFKTALSTQCFQASSSKTVVPSQLFFKTALSTQCFQASSSKTVFSSQFPKAVFPRWFSQSPHFREVGPGAVNKSISYPIRSALHPKSNGLEQRGSSSDQP